MLINAAVVKQVYRSYDTQASRRQDFSPFILLIMRNMLKYVITSVPFRIYSSWYCNKCL